MSSVQDVSNDGAQQHTTQQTTCHTQASANSTGVVPVGPWGHVAGARRVLGISARVTGWWPVALCMAQAMQSC